MLNSRLWIALMGLLVLAESFLLSGCARFPGESDTREALRSLHLLSDGMSAGLSHDRYCVLLGNARLKTKTATQALPPGELKQEIEKALEGYEDAEKAWEAQDLYDQMLAEGRLPTWAKPRIHTDGEPGKTLIPKYSLVDLEKSRPEFARQIICALTLLHVQRADKLFEEGGAEHVGR